MSTRYSVRFEQQQDQSIPAALEAPAREVAKSLRKCDRDAVRFVFQVLTVYPYPSNAPTRLKVVQLYRNSVRRAGSLRPEELDVCANLQIIYNIAASGELIKKALSFVLECYHVIELRETSGDAVFHNATVELGGELFKGEYEVQTLGDTEKHKHKTVDIGVDLLDKDLSVELAECASSLSQFRGGRKRTQLRFYVEILSSIRKIVGVDAKLKLTLIAANSRGERFRLSPFNKEILKAERATIRANKIRVVGIGTAENVEEWLDWLG